MKKFLLLFPVFLCQAKLCQRQEEFSACSTKAATQISACSAEVSGAVTTSLYGCLCKQNKAMLDCYDLCLDDPQLVQQKQSQMENVNAACAVTVITTATTPAMQSSSSVLSATSTATSPPIATQSRISMTQESESTGTAGIPAKTSVGASRTTTVSERSKPSSVALDSAESDFSITTLFPVLLAML